MAVKYSKRVWRDKKLKGGKLLVMLALADHATEDGDSWPGMPLLTDKTRLTDRQIRRVLNTLAEDGYITIEERAVGRGKRPHYKLFPNEKADILSDQNEEKADISDSKSGHFVHEKADISDTNQSHVRREPITEPPIEPVGESVRVVQSGIRGAKKLTLHSPYLKKSKFVNGFIPPGKGKNAVEVYYERFQINLDDWRLTDPLEDDLVASCKDLELLREVVVAYHQSNFKTPRNIKLILDWYKDPSRFRNKQNGNHNGNHQQNYQRPETSKHGMAEHQAHDAKRRAAGRPY